VPIGFAYFRDGIRKVVASTGRRRPGRLLLTERQNPHSLTESNHLLHTSVFGLSCRMDWQQLVSLFIVAAAAVGLVGSKLRRRRLRFDQAGHCGCSTVVGSFPQTSIVFRARKGKRPEVLLKMR